MEEKDNLEKEEIIDDTTSSTASNDNEAASTEQEAASKTEENESELSVEVKLRDVNQDLKDTALRLCSAFKNYRSRRAKERLDLIKPASEDVMLDLISVVDEFERALTVESSDAQALMEGHLLI